MSEENTFSFSTGFDLVSDKMLNEATNNGEHLALPIKFLDGAFTNVTVLVKDFQGVENENATDDESKFQISYNYAVVETPTEDFEYDQGLLESHIGVAVQKIMDDLASNMENSENHQNGCSDEECDCVK